MITNNEIVMFEINFGDRSPSELWSILSSVNIDKVYQYPGSNSAWSTLSPTTAHQDCDEWGYFIDAADIDIHDDTFCLAE